MIHDLEKVGFAIEDADVCIVGAGAAGIFLAIEMARSGKKVLLLESGGRLEEPPTTDLYRSEVGTLPHKGIHEGRHRVYGGSTIRWGGQILELFEHDFQSRQWIKGSGWPISQHELTPYYERALRLQGVANVTRDDKEVWREVGLSLCDLGDDLIPFFSRWCQEPNFTKLHGNELKMSNLLHVYLHANAIELLLSEDNETVTGVRCRTLSGREKIFSAKNFVLCLGGIETIRFLLQPHANGHAPWNQNHWLGRHFQDHLDVYCAELIDIDTGCFYDFFDHICRRGYRYEPRFRLTEAVQRRHGLLNVGGMVFFEDPPGAQRHQVWQTMKRLLRGRHQEISFKDMQILVGNLPTLLKQLARYKIQGRSYNPESLVRFRLRAFCEQEPLGESRVSLSMDQDALGQYRTRLDWKISDLELRTLQYFVYAVTESFAKLGLARVIPDADLMNHPELFVSKVMDSYHHMGGTRMAASSDNGFVDPNLKIFGTRNAFVCSSSVFPSSGFSNPTHTLLALTCRLVEHLVSNNN